MLAIEVALLTGRYVATAYNSRQEGEWPPHPARLFSALVATHAGCETPPPDERAVLEWLEAQGAPSICASDATTRELTTVFVPVNDSGMTNVDAEGEAVDAARAELVRAQAEGDAKQTKKAASAVDKAEKRFVAAVERSTAVPKTAAKPSARVPVLPEHRVRQPRTFPSVTPVIPQVTYLWPNVEATKTQRDALDQLLSRLVRVGHSSSLASARLVDGPVAAVWRPSPSGETILRTVQAGQLQSLERAHALHRETEPRLMPSRFTSYTTLTPREESQMPHTVFSDDWLVLRRLNGPVLPMVATAGVARSLRKALMAQVRDGIPEMLSGHMQDGGSSERDHLAIVPLPFVGRAEASGSILGIALILPRSTADAERRAVYARVDAWEGRERIDDEDTPCLPLQLGTAGVLGLERVEDGAAQTTLRPTTWTRPAREWLSVTPVALDRNPGELRSRDARKLATAVAEAQATLRAACVRVGLPEPIDVEVLPAAPIAGATKAKLYPHFPDQPGRTPRILTHARLYFDAPVRGPILLGAGRYHGLGLFRPVHDRG